MTWFSWLFRKRTPIDPYGPDSHLHFAADELPNFGSEYSGQLSKTGVPGFSASASSLERIADSNRAALSGQRRPAFVPSQPVARAAEFAGRAALLKRVIRAIEDQHLHVIIYGDRGIGKTSILRVVCELAVRAKYIVHYSSCGEDSEFTDMFRIILGKIPLRFDRESDPSIEAVERGGTLADLLPDRHYSVSQLSDVLAGISGTRVLVVLDEFDRVASPRFSVAIAELIKNLSDRAIPLQLVIAGVSSSLTDLIKHVPSIRRNIVGVGVPNMLDDEIRELISVGERSADIAFESDALDRVVVCAGGLPHLAGLLGQYAVLAAGDDDSLPAVKLSHVESARLRGMEDLLGQLSPGVQLTLTSGSFPGGAEMLNAAAADAVLHGGVIADPAIIAQLQALPDMAQKLLEPYPNNAQGGWRFVEDGISAYLWLTSAHALPVR